MSAGHKTLPVTTTESGHVRDSTRAIPTEVPVALVYKGVSHVVMMATPADLEEFGLGFSLSENIIASPAELTFTDVIESEKGYVVSMDIPEERHQAIASRRRHLAGRSGCGLCGVESLEEAAPDLTPLPDTAFSIAPEALYKAFEALPPYQPEKQATGAVHAAAWCSTEGEVLYVREDVGRHNALDKLIGALAHAEAETGAGFCLITSRCSYEMVQKAVQVGMPVLAAISAPTTMAVDMAAQNNLTLIALARQQTFTVFAHGHRLTNPTAAPTVESAGEPA